MTIPVICGLTQLILLLGLQLPLERAILEAEDARSTDMSVFEEGLRSPERQIRRLAIRAVGRLERSANAGLIVPFLASPDAGLRLEAVAALGRMRADVDLEARLGGEKDPRVRGLIYDVLGRLPQGTEEVLASGLAEAALEAKTGAARGLETYFRIRAGESKPSAATINTLRKTVQQEDSAVLLELALLTLNAAGDTDLATYEAALRHPEAQVRRLATAGVKRWRDDPSYLVRYESLRAAGNCERAAAAVNDPSPHVALLALDLLGKDCAAEPLEQIFENSRDWRRQAHALTSLARVRPESARRLLEAFSRHPRWQARAHAAEAAKTLNDEAVLARLARDENPNVVAAALSAPADALRALRSSHYGLIMRAAAVLEGRQEGSSAVPELLAALERISAEGRDTSRDPRRAILELLGKFADASIVGRLEPLLTDFDPVIAGLAAQVISQKSGKETYAKTTRMRTRPVPAQSYLDGLKGGRARIRMKEAGSFTLELLVEEAPVTVAGFAQLVEAGYYDNLTFHRIVPNFVIQGGSPGANEYDGTAHYLRDELGSLSHLRGTAGISTRGRDTGDSQIFINLVDNFRLDNNYTVFARVVEGMETVDMIQEGDIIEDIRIIRRVPSR